MKIQGLAIIFIIIIMPITIVLSEYVNNKITIAQTELEYNTRLLNSTYDAIKAYQLNTVNNAFGDISTSKVKDIEAAAKTFLNSVSSNFNYTGYNSNTMQSYIPAIAFTLYDGYYVYAPFRNTLTEVTDNDTTYSEDGKTMYGLKPYVYYSCRYVNTDASKNWDFIITYTLDNYITIQGLIKNKYVYDCGYLYSIDNPNGIQKNGNNYIYDGITFSENETEELKEWLGNTEYSYAKINGTKYYLEEKDDGENVTETYNGNSFTFSRNNQIFFIDDTGEKNYSQTKGYNDDKTTFLKYYFAIKQNKSNYEYYKHAYEFSKAVLTNDNITGYKDKAGKEFNYGYNLSSLKSGDAYIYNYPASDATSIKEYGDYLLFTDNPQEKSSNFNKHRQSIIRYVVETNLSASIAAFKDSTHSNIDFLMPKISEPDWEIIENDVCAISFLQGLNIGSKKYNGYSVVANTLTKEYIDEDDIYILANDGINNIYCKTNDKTLVDGTVNIFNKGNNPNTELTYYPGIWKINFEQKQDVTSVPGETIYYNPINFLGSYTSIMGSSGTTAQENEDIYMYIHKPGTNTKLKEVYYRALGRERWCSFNVNNINYELYGNNRHDEYFLIDYEV